MAPTAVARERAMTFRDVIVQAITAKLAWWQAAEILGVTARTMRRWRLRYQQYGVSRLQDRRRVDREGRAGVRRAALRACPQIPPESRPEPAGRQGGGGECRALLTAVNLRASYCRS